MTSKRRREKAAFVSSPEVLAHLPEVSGNAINGFGESDVSRPKPVMWHDPEILPHGELQKWFRVQRKPPASVEYRRQSIAYTRETPPDIAPQRPGWSATEWTARVKEAALSRGADLVGIARMNRDWVFEGFEADYRWIVVLVVAMDYDNLAGAPDDASDAEVMRQYCRGTGAAYKLAGWMREHGWDAKPHGGPEAGPVLMIPPAIEAGLGELGKHGSMINREFGASFRLACVMTDIPLIADRPDLFGADEFCTGCRLCTDACPVDAIHTEKQLVRGETKWYVDFDQCIRYFVEHQGCALCLPICPWSRPGVAPRLAEKMTRRIARGGETLDPAG
ncbi:MAG: 4Fe-4S dicluster domain-containing protein [Defluviicoccus sp.]|nr:4Fe-4S dicluster domain-containing protein [Defluviicoccus sp.]MDE0382421.1 4Fe-4S dicluster domain-containing protein [Defluviicoccus sp.]